MSVSKSGKRGIFWMLTLGSLLLVTGIFVINWEGQRAEDPSVPGANQGALVEVGCVQQQSLHYQRCGHEVLRRIDVPAAWLGMDRARVQAELPEDSRITSFSARRIDVQRTIPLYCPQHWVLQTDETGLVCIWINRYGEQMESMYPTGVSATDVPDAQHEALREGIAFDTLEDAERFLEAFEAFAQ